MSELKRGVVSTVVLVASLLLLDGFVCLTWDGVFHWQKFGKSKGTYWTFLDFCSKLSIATWLVGQAIVGRKCHRRAWQCHLGGLVAHSLLGLVPLVLYCYGHRMFGIGEWPADFGANDLLQFMLQSSFLPVWNQVLIHWVLWVFFAGLSSVLLRLLFSAKDSGQQAGKTQA